MANNWFRELISWLKADWIEWIILVVYMGILYWMAQKNWQIIRFPGFITIFTLISLALVIAYKYLKKI